MAWIGPLGMGRIFSTLARGSLRKIAVGWKERINLGAQCDQPPPRADALLIRPDGYLACVASPGDSEEEVQLALRHALAT